jgi:hypothetical protein
MTLDQIENSLPNGFHDARLNKIDINYVSRVAKFELQIDIKRYGDQDKKHEEVHRDGIITLNEVLFIVIEAPDPSYPYQKTKGLWIADSGKLESIKPQKAIPETLPEGAFTYYFFINDWNAFIYFSAMSANFEYKT